MPRQRLSAARRWGRTAVILVAAVCPIFATDDAENVARPEAEDHLLGGFLATGWQGVGQDLAAVARRVRQPTRRGRRFAGLMAGATVLGYFGRHEIREMALRNRSDTRTDIYDAARLLSRGGVAPAVALGLAAAGRLQHNPERVRAARRLLTACGGALLTAGVAQLAVATDRPEDGNRVRLFRANGHSVSADATLAACLVDPVPAAVWPRHPDESRAHRRSRRWLRGLLLGGAVLTAVQRVDADKHWAPDAFLGVMNGLSWGRWMSRDQNTTAAPAAAPGTTRRVAWQWHGTAVTARIRLGRRTPFVDTRTLEVRTPR